MSLLRALVVLAVLAAGPASAGEALVAVATNFLTPAEALVEAFEGESGHAIRLTSGSTGKLAAQIRNGAPYDALLAADQARPALLVDEGLAREESRFTYARGRLALWSPAAPESGADGVATLGSGDFEHLAIANPRLAPYGAAAMHVIEALGLTERLTPKLVLGENVGQAHAMVATGNAEMGFVALSGLAGPGASPGGFYWEVPEGLHAPIRQDAVVLARAAADGPAAAFLDFLKTDAARTIVAGYGYGVE